MRRAKGKETARMQHIGRGNQTSARQIKMERTRSWPHSLRGDRELREPKFVMVRVCYGPSLCSPILSWSEFVMVRDVMESCSCKDS